MVDVKQYCRVVSVTHLSSSKFCTTSHTDFISRALICWCQALFFHLFFRSLLLGGISPLFAERKLVLDQCLKVISLCNRPESCKKSTYGQGECTDPVTHSHWCVRLVISSVSVCATVALGCMISLHIWSNCATEQTQLEQEFNFRLNHFNISDGKQPTASKGDDEQVTCGPVQQKHLWAIRTAPVLHGTDSTSF